jgi:phosphatidylserine/phosphatidylglycerophosphate/cardiolipin synthase-like enzyme
MKRAFFIVGIIVLVFAVLGPLGPGAIIDREQPASTQTATPSSRGVRGLVVLPEDGPDAILDEINQANTSIDLYVYLLPSEQALTALSGAHERGVTVRVILERDPFGGGGSNQDAYDRLTAAGIDVHWSSDHFAFSHIKTFVVDQQVAVIMTLNLSWSALTRNREFAVVTTVPADVAEVARLFEADWSGSHYQPQGDLVTSADNSRLVLGDLIDSAQVTIEVYAEVIRDGDMRELLIEAARRGIRVRILVPSNPTDDALSIYRELEQSGVEVRLLADAYSHAKAIVVDGARAFVGSQNLTQGSLDRNRELGIILTDRPNLDRLHGVFESDWATSPAA